MGPITRIGFVKVQMNHLVRHGHYGRRQREMLVRRQPDDKATAGLSLAIGLILARHGNEVKFYIIPGWKLPSFEGRGFAEQIIDRPQVVGGKVQHLTGLQR